MQHRAYTYGINALVLIASSTIAFACSGRDDGDNAADGASTTAALGAVVDPADNPTSAAKIALGRLLFWDPVISGDRDIACATCHHPDYAYTDGRKLSVGTGGRGLGPARVVGATPHETTRNAMTVLNAARNGTTATAHVPAESAPMFWDNRVTSLETQAKGPVSALNEMRGASYDETTIVPEIVARLVAIPEYVVRFNAAFGASGITDANVFRAIATFERTLVVTDSSFDRHVAGTPSALTPQAAHGFDVFTRSGCAGCHSGPMFSDFKLHRIAARRGNVVRSADVGAGGGAFRTQSLRNVGRTAPYMHDGAFETLDQVLDLYRNVDDGGDDKLRELRVPDGADRADLIAFLQALSDGDYDRTIPDGVPSGLAVGGAIR